MKSLHKFFVLIMFICAVAAADAQYTEQQLRQVTNAREAAEKAFNDGKYREAINQAQQVEKLLNISTSPVTSHIKVISYHRLGEYQNCVNAAKAYLSTSPANDYRLVEIKAAEADAQQKLKAKKDEQDRIAENARKKAAHEKAASDEWARIKDSENVQAMDTWLLRYGDTPLAQTVRNRIAAVKNLLANRSKNAFEKEAADEWARIRNTQDIPTVQQFLNRYGSTAMAQTARNRIAAINEMKNSRTKYAELEKKLKQQKKSRNKKYVGNTMLTVLGAGLIYGGYVMRQQIQEDETKSPSTENWKTYGTLTMVFGGISALGGITGYISTGKSSGKLIKQTKSEMRSLRPNTTLSLQPQVIPFNPLNRAYAPKDLAYGFRATITF